MAEFPKHPLPHVPPQPEQPQQPRVQPPTVFVYEERGWEYKVVMKSADERPVSEDELNALGNEGWELVGVVQLPTKAQFFFRRVRS